MNLLKRLKNLWEISGQTLPNSTNVISKDTKENNPRRLATIIKMKDPVKDFLRNNQDE